MKKISFLSIILSFFILSSFAYADNLKYKLDDSTSYTLVTTYAIKNLGSNNAKNVKLVIFDGKQNFLTYQKDLEVQYSPIPDRVTKDKFDNKVLEYEFDYIPPGQNIEVNVTRKVISSNIEYDLDKIRSNSQLVDETKDELYLQPQIKIESKNQGIILKANQITEGLIDDYSKAQEIFGFVNLYMTYDESQVYRNKGAVSALVNKRGVCEDYAALFAALCRASGIPVRVIDGYRFEDISENVNLGEWHQAEKYGHVWAEFYLEGHGWIPVEATQIYTVNNIKEVYWDGYAKLNSSQYIGTNLYNSSKLNEYQDGEEYQEANVILTYYAGEKLVLEPIETMVRIDNVQANPDDNANDNEFNDDITNQISFIDLSEKDWGYYYINNVFSKGIIKGYEDNTFKPDNNISRIEFLVMLSRLLKYLNYPEIRGDAFTFNDYPSNHWSKEEYNYLANCFEMVEPSTGWLYGQATLMRVFSNKLDPNKPITRGEAVALFDKFLNEYDNYDRVFIDIDNSKFKSSILKANKNQLINGYPGNYFKPQNNISRRETAKIFDTYLNLFLE